MKKKNLEGWRTMIQTEIVERFILGKSNSLRAINHPGEQNKKITNTNPIIKPNHRRARIKTRRCYTIRNPKSRDNKGNGGDEYGIQARDKQNYRLPTTKDKTFDDKTD